MEKCLLIASTFAEIEPFLTHFTGENPAWAGELELDVFVTGVGLTQTAYGLTKQIALKKPGLVIQAGLAGALDKKTKPGNVYLVSSDRVGDEIVFEKGKLVTMTGLGLRKSSQPPYKNEWLTNPHKALLKRAGLPRVKAISANQVSTDKKTIRAYRDHYKASLESMEGAALHLVCLSEQIPFLQLRAVSNPVGERDKKKWKMKKATRQLNRALIALMEEIAKHKNKEK